jgi:hypothetical protein
MADGVVFSIDGYDLPCPKFQPGWFEPGDIDYSYLNGSKLYIGMSKMTYTWPFLDETYVAIIRTLYDGLVASFDPLTATGTPITATVPDFLGGGWKYTTCYITEPTGTAGGSGSTNFSVKLYNLGEQNLLDHIASPGTDLWELMQQGASLEIGSSEYPASTWQFS